MRREACPEEDSIRIAILLMTFYQYSCILLLMKQRESWDEIQCQRVYWFIIGVFMPIYEFECSKCDRYSGDTAWVSMKNHQRKCECGGKLKKLISLSSFQLQRRRLVFHRLFKKSFPNLHPCLSPQQMGKMLLSNLSKKDNKAIADSISKDVKKAKG